MSLWELMTPVERWLMWVPFVLAAIGVGVSVSLGLDRMTSIDDIVWDERDGCWVHKRELKRRKPGGGS